MNNSRRLFISLSNHVCSFYRILYEIYRKRENSYEIKSALKKHALYVKNNTQSICGLWVWRKRVCSIGFIYHIVSKIGFIHVYRSIIRESKRIYTRIMTQILQIFIPVMPSPQICRAWQNSNDESPRVSIISSDISFVKYWYSWVWDQRI